MAFFGFGKKKEETKAPACACQCGSAAQEIGAAEQKNDCCTKSKDDLCSIKVLGAGCASCHALLESTKEAVNTAGLCAEVEYVTDMPKIMAYGVMRLPALVVNEQVVSAGKVLKAAEAEKLLRKLGL